MHGKRRKNGRRKIKTITDKIGKMEKERRSSSSINSSSNSRSDSNSRSSIAY